jgi:hypothetical protein
MVSVHRFVKATFTACDAVKVAFTDRGVDRNSAASCERARDPRIRQERHKRGLSVGSCELLFSYRPDRKSVTVA